MAPLGAARALVSGGVPQPELPSGTNLTGSSLYAIMNEYANAKAQSVTTGGSLTVNSTDVGDYDYVIIDGDATFNGTNSTFFTNNTDKHALIWVNGNLSIASSTLIPSNRKMSMSIHVGGTFSMDGGTVSMSRRGGNHYNNSANRNVNATTIKLTSNIGPIAGPGGGGTGHNASSGPAGSGASGTAFSGGPGGGGTGGGAAGNGQPRGGKGGNAVQTYTQAGGGAGNPLGSGNNNGSHGQDGTGGAIFIFAGAVSGSGNLQAVGGHGAFGPGPNDNSPGFGAGGGGSGGGQIRIFRGTNNSTTFNTNVSGGGGGRQAQSGSSGSVAYYTASDL